MPITNDDATCYVRKLIKDFVIPGKDMMAECMLSLPDDRLVWNAGVFISTGQAENFYSDIFQFWTRALFSFSENTQEGSLLWDVSPLVSCRAISPEEFQRNYFWLIQKHVPDDFFIENQSCLQTYVELKQRTFSDCCLVLDQPDIKSAVSKSGEEFVCYVIRDK